MAICLSEVPINYGSPHLNPYLLRGQVLSQGYGYQGWQYKYRFPNLGDISVEISLRIGANQGKRSIVPKCCICSIQKYGMDDFDLFKEFGMEVHWTDMAMDNLPIRGKEAAAPLYGRLDKLRLESDHKVQQGHPSHLSDSRGAMHCI